MCEPVSATIGAAALIGGVANGLAQADAASARAASLNRNAALTDQAADQALQRGEAEAGRVVLHGEQVEAAQRTAYASAGVDLATGSAARTQGDTAAITAIDAETTRNNAQREAWGLKAQATNMRRDAADTESAGQNALAAGIIGGAAGAASATLGGLQQSGYFKTSAPKPPGIP